MGVTISIDVCWKTVLALGVGIGIVILASKVSSEGAERTINHTVDVYGETSGCKVACESN